MTRPGSKARRAATRAARLLCLLAGLGGLGGLAAGCGEAPEAPCGDADCGPLTRCDEATDRCAPRDDLDAARLDDGLSLAVTPDGLVLVAASGGDDQALALGVYDAVEQRLRYQRLVPDAGDGAPARADDLALALYPDGRPAILYHDPARARLGFAFLDEDGAWRHEVVDSAAGVGFEPDLYIDPVTGDAHAAYRDEASRALRYAERLRGVWRPEFVDLGIESPAQLPAEDACPLEQRQLVRRGVGLGPSLVVQDTTPVIAYHDADCGALRLARRSADGWVLRVLDGWRADAAQPPRLRPAVGRFSDVALDPVGNLAVAYFDATQGVLKLARSQGGTTTFETIDDGVRQDGALDVRKHIVGQRPVLVSDAARGVMVAVHMDATTRRVLLSESVDAQRWRTTALPPEAGEGLRNALAISAEGVYHVGSLSLVRPADAPVRLSSLITTHDASAPAP